MFYHTLLRAERQPCRSRKLLRQRHLPHCPLKQKSWIDKKNKNTYQAVFQKKVLEQLKETQLTVGQPKVLDYLKDHNGVSQKELALGCRIEAGSLTSILNRMEEKGMIERRIQNGNRRTFHIYLTPKGEELQKCVENAFLVLEEEVFKGISLEDREAFMRIFQDIYKNIMTME